MLIRSTLRSSFQRTATRGIATHARSTLKVALLPADGIGKEVIPVRVLHLLSTRVVSICAHFFAII